MESFHWAKAVPPLGRTVNLDQIRSLDIMSSLQGSVEHWTPAIKYLLLDCGGKRILKGQNFNEPNKYPAPGGRNSPKLLCSNQQKCEGPSQ